MKLLRLFIALIMVIMAVSAAFSLEITLVGDYKTSTTVKEIVADNGEEFKIIAISSDRPSEMLPYDYNMWVELVTKTQDKNFVRFRFKSFFFDNTPEDEYSLKINKVKDFNDITVYEFLFTYIYRERVWDAQFEVTQKYLFWVDNDTRNYRRNYSGSFYFLPDGLNTVSLFEDKYKTLQEMFVYLIENELDNFENALSKGQYYHWSPLTEAISWVDTFDENKVEEFMDRYKSLKAKDKGWWNTFSRTYVWLIYLTHPAFFIQDRPIDNIAGQNIAKPIASELPVNEDELKEYLAWNMQLRPLLYDLDSDSYKVELIPGGLRATYEGEGGMFGKITRTLTYEQAEEWVNRTQEQQADVADE